MTTYANFTDDHIEAPAEHAKRTHAYPAAGDSRHPPRLVIAAFDDVDDSMADGRWLACPKADAVAVER